MRMCEQEVHIFRSVPLRYFFSLRAPSGPLMGTLKGTHVGTPMGHPLFKKETILVGGSPILGHPLNH